MASPRNALGRGIGALIPKKPPEPVSTAARRPTGGPREIPLDFIDPNPQQPRRVFDAVELDRLADSIRVHGVLQPVVVRPAGERYELVVGERRWRAARVAGLPRIPAVVADVDGHPRMFNTSRIEERDPLTDVAVLRPD